MIDHISMPVTDYARSKALYAAAFHAIGWTLLVEATPANTEGHVPACGFGEDQPIVWIVGGQVGDGCHVAVRVPTRDAVAAFHAAALRAGATDNGAPGPRPHYGDTYYAAFVRDFDGHNVEAVCYATA